MLGEADFSAARFVLAAAEPVGFFDPDLAAVYFFLSAALSLVVVLTADLDLRVSRTTVVLAFFTGEAALAEVVLRVCFVGLLEADGLAAAEAFAGDLDNEAAALPTEVLKAFAGVLAGDFEGDFDGFAAFLTDAFDTDLLMADALVTDGALEAAAAYFETTDLFETDLCFATEALATDAFVTDALATDALVTEAAAAFATDCFLVEAGLLLTG